MINNKQQLKNKIKSKIYKTTSNYYDNMNIRIDEDHFARNAPGVSKNYHEVFSIMEFLQTKPQLKNMNTNYFDFYYTVIRNRNDKETVNVEYEK